MSEFDGKIVLVTGCGRARGMGRAISVAFARAGADVVVTDVAPGGTRNENEEGLAEIRLGWKGLESLAGEIQGLGRRVLTLVGDVSRAVIPHMLSRGSGRARAERDPNAPVLALPPTGRIARPDDIARLALFFASEQSDHITGQAWNVDGGTVMH